MFVIVLCALYLQIPWNLLSESAFRSLVSSTQQASITTSTSTWGSSTSTSTSTEL